MDRFKNIIQEQKNNLNLKLYCNFHMGNWWHWLANDPSLSMSSYISTLVFISPLPRFTLRVRPELQLKVYVSEIICKIMRNFASASANADFWVLKSAFKSASASANANLRIIFVRKILKWFRTCLPCNHEIKYTWLN